MAILNRMQSAIQDSEEKYHRLVLLVGEPRSGKTPALKELAKRIDRDILNLNLTVTESLLDCPKQKLPLRANDAVRDAIERTGADPVLVDNLEVLFDPDLQLDPLALLQGLSRSRVVVATWPGRFEDGALSYAARGHPEHRRYDDPDAILIPIDEQDKETT